MKENVKKQRILLMAALMMVFTLVINCVPAYAAPPELKKTKMNIGVNWTKKIKVKNKNKEAEYTYSSADTTIAKVSSKGVVTGVSVGETSVKVEQVLNNKKTTVGTVAVNVKKASLDTSYIDNGYSLSSQAGIYQQPEYGEWLLLEMLIKYNNPEAVYECYSTNTEKLKISVDGKIEDVKGTGTVTVEIKETYKDKTTMVGSFELKIEEPSLYRDSWSVVSGEILYTDEYLHNVGRYQIIVSDSKKQPTEAEFNAEGNKFNSDIITVESEDWEESLKLGEYVRLKAVKSGTAYFHYAAYDYIQGKYTDYLGYITVTVEDISSISDIIFPWEEDDSFEYKYNDKKGLQLYEGEDAYIYIKQIPEKYSGEYIVTSSNPEIVTVSVQENYIGYYEGGMELELCPEKVGTATITIEANGVKKTFKVTVGKND